MQGFDDLATDDCINVFVSVPVHGVLCCGHRGYLGYKKGMTYSNTQHEKPTVFVYYVYYINIFCYIYNQHKYLLYRVVHEDLPISSG